MAFLEQCERPVVSMTNEPGKVNVKGIVVGIVFALTAHALVSQSAPHVPLGIVSDWTHHHVLYPDSKDDSVMVLIQKDPRLKSFATPFDAICEFLGFENFSGSSDGRLGHILLYIPNLNARLAQLQLKDNLLHVVVDGSAQPDSLKLDLAYKNKSETASITKRLEMAEATLELSFRPTELYLWLISVLGFIGDFHDENEHYSKGANALLPKKKQASFVDMEFDDDQLSSSDTDVHPRRVFVIHGHDTSYRESVARFLEKLGLEPVILHEQPNLGNTIIEKFETHFEVAFALALLTGDDEARVVNDTMPLRPRARQNVIFEFGYFIGKLGRRHVCALREKDVEIPSDYHGVVYIPLDDSGRWKLELVRELKAAGFAVDANRAVE